MECITCNFNHANKVSCLTLLLSQTLTLPANPYHSVFVDLCQQEVSSSPVKQEAGKRSHEWCFVGNYA